MWKVRQFEPSLEKGNKEKEKKWDKQKGDFNFVLFETGVVVCVRLAHMLSPQGEDYEVCPC